MAALEYQNTLATLNWPPTIHSTSQIDLYNGHRINLLTVVNKSDILVGLKYISLVSEAGINYINFSFVQCHFCCWPLNKAICGKGFGF